MSILSLFDIGRTTLLTTQKALSTTGHNVANASTPGYSRQDVVLENIPGGGEIIASGESGRGVTIGSVQRAYDSLTSLQLITEKANLSYWDTYQSGMNKVENIFNEASDTGISAAISDFFDAWQQVAQNPQSYAQRSVLLAKANTLTSRINNAAVALDDAKSEIYKSTSTSVTQVNNYL
ncbi:MAG TPA: flagellar basal body protein, partial [Dissulfurispiraceae bacterium]|nr:flagellar basal body protein [Dissulfurispiraceae bacterium]